MTAQCLQERLEASGYEAAQQRSVTLDIAHTGCALNALSRRSADEADLYSPDRRFPRHVRHVRRTDAGPTSVELLTSYRTGRLCAPY